jgi:hypothetical protein
LSALSTLAPEVAPAFNAAADSQLANLAINEAGGNALSGYLTNPYGLPTMSPVGSSLLDTLANGAKNLLGPLASKTGAGLAATALGGLLGAKGEQKAETETKKLDPRMDQYIYGADGKGGLLGDVNKLYQQQLASGGMNDLQRLGLQTQQNWLRSPEYSQGFTSMRNIGQGLLGRGVAPNPFNR